jgi:hypothetical protein
MEFLRRISCLLYSVSCLLFLEGNSTTATYVSGGDVI